MEQVFVAKKGTSPLDNDGTAVIDFATLHHLSEGAIAVMGYHSTGVLPSSVAVAGTDGIPEKIIIYQAMPTGSAQRQSLPLVPGYFTVNTQAYVAGVPAVVFLGLNGSTGAMQYGTPAIGAEYGVEITDLTEPTYTNRRTEIVKVCISESLTIATAMSNLVTAINANTKIAGMLTAAVVNSDDAISFTAVDSTKNFTVRPIGLFYGSTVTTDGTGTATVGTPAFGAYNEVAAAEQRGMVLEGKLNTTRASDQIWKVPAYAVAGTTYDVININVKLKTTRSGYGVPSDNLTEGSITIFYDHSDAADYSALYTYLQTMSDPASYLYANQA